MDVRVDLEAAWRSPSARADRLGEVVAIVHAMRALEKFLR
jgi:hypothetical protein